jgi:hypothetical protein
LSQSRRGEGRPVHAVKKVGRNRALVQGMPVPRQACGDRDQPVGTSRPEPMQTIGINQGVSSIWSVLMSSANGPPVIVCSDCDRLQVLEEPTALSASYPGSGRNPPARRQRRQSELAAASARPKRANEQDLAEFRRSARRRLSLARRPRLRADRG